MKRRMISTGALLVDPAGRLLLQQRDNFSWLMYPGWWTTFGGAAEFGETADDAIRRELQEEIGLSPSVFLWRAFDRHVEIAGEPLIVEQHMYAGRIDPAQTPITLHEGQAYGFFTLADLDSLPVAFDFKDLLREFFATIPALGLDQGLKEET
jgi:8-oxo-dGTP diphosphatase